MKILVATDVPITFMCGSTCFVERLGILLQKRGHQFAVVCPSQTVHAESYTRADGIIIYGIPSFPILVRKNLRLSPLVGIQSAIQKVILEFKPDVIHAQTHFAIPRAAAVIAKKFNIPIMGTNHFVPENVLHHLPFSSILGSLMRWEGWRGLHSTFNKFDIITTPTETAAQLFHKSGFKKLIIAISNGVDLSIFHPGHNAAAIKQKYKLTAMRTMLFVGRLDPEKNIDHVLLALPEILKRIDAHFIIIGRGSEDVFLNKLTQKLGLEKNVTFLGFVPSEDLPALYAAADCFVMPGTAELQSIATMEAMASGLPVVAVSAMALPELVHDGENGYLFSHEDSDMFAECVVKIFSDDVLRKKMGDKSLEMIQRHDIKHTLEKYEALYQQVIAGRVQ